MHRVVSPSLLPRAAGAIITYVGGVAFEYVAALDVCVFRVVAKLAVSEIVAIVAAAAVRYPGAASLWDLSALGVPAWSPESITRLVSTIRLCLDRTTNGRVALVARAEVGISVLRPLHASETSGANADQLEVFDNRAMALEWLGVMNRPVGT